jgi:hypothetical protein
MPSHRKLNAVRRLVPPTVPPPDGIVPLSNLKLPEAVSPVKTPEVASTLKSYIIDEPLAAPLMAIVAKVAACLSSSPMPNWRPPAGRWPGPAAVPECAYLHSLRSTTSPNPPAAASAGAITNGSRAPRYSVAFGGEVFIFSPCNRCFSEVIGASPSVADVPRKPCKAGHDMDEQAVSRRQDESWDRLTRPDEPRLRVQ